MKHAQRLPYLILTEIDIPSLDTEWYSTWNLSLCHFCKYALWYSDGESACSESALECGHGIEKISELCNDIWADSTDCWGFRPRYKREDCVDAIGIVLRGEWPDWTTLRKVRK